MDETLAHFEGQGYGFLKTEVAQAICDELLPIQKRYFEIMENDQLITDALASGTQTANAIADAKVAHVKKAFGLF